MKEKKGEIMLNNWNEEDFQKALSNYKNILKERPGDAELLRNYQMISLEYERYKKREGKILCPDCFRKSCDWCKFKDNEYLFRQIEALNGEYPKYCPWCGSELSI